MKVNRNADVEAATVRLVEFQSVFLAVFDVVVNRIFEIFL